MLCSSLFPLVDSLLCGEAAATLQENPLEWETEASCQQPCEFTIPEGILQPQSSLQMTAASADLLIGTTQQTLNHSHSAKPLLNSCPAENLTFFFLLRCKIRVKVSFYSTSMSNFVSTIHWTIILSPLNCLGAFVKDQLVSGIYPRNARICQHKNINQHSTPQW